MLSFMARGYFSENDLLVMPLVALLIFIVIFALVTLRALRAEKATIATLARLPLVDDKSPLTSLRAKGAAHE